MYTDTNDALNNMIGKTVSQILISEDYLSFHFTNGDVQNFVVHGDCCSTSYFSEVYGADKLVGQGPIIDVKFIDETDGLLMVPAQGEGDYADYIQVYGFKIVSDHPLFGDVTTVFGFRNESNGYYGGWMEVCEASGDDMVVVKSNWYAS